MYLEPIEQQPIKRKMYLEPIETPSAMPKQPTPMTLKGYGQNALNDLKPSNIYQNIIKPQVVEPIKATIRNPMQMAKQVTRETLQMPAQIGNSINRLVTTNPVETLKNMNRAAYEHPVYETGKALIMGQPLAAPIRAGISGTGKIAGQIVDKTGITRAGRISKIEPLTKEATAIYRDVLKPTKGEIENINIRQGKDIDRLYKLAAEEKLPINKTKSLDGTGNVLDTKQARGILDEKISAIHNELTPMLEKSNATINLVDIQESAIKNLKGKFNNAAEYYEAVDDVMDYIGKEIKLHNSGVVSVADANTIKQGMWQVKYKTAKPNSKDIAGFVGHEIKEAIEKAVPDVSVKKLNTLSGEYQSLRTLLKKAEGRVIKGGKLGNYVAQAVGTAIGTAAGAPIPYVGPIAGGLAGRWAGSKIQQAMTSPARLSAKGAAKMGQVQKYMAESKTIPNPVLNLEALKKQVNSKLRDNRGAINPSGDIKPVGMPKQPMPKGGIRTYATENNVHPDTEITIYKGVGKTKAGGIQSNDWVTQNKHDAEYYMRDRAKADPLGGKVISKKVKASELILDPSTNPGVTNEFKYIPKK